MTAKIIGLVCAAGFGLALASSSGATAMPNGLAGIQHDASTEQVRLVCNRWGRCWRRPNYYGAYGFYGGPRVYGPRFYGPRWGWHRGWRRW